MWWIIWFWLSLSCCCFAATRKIIAKFSLTHDLQVIGSKWKCCWLFHLTSYTQLTLEHELAFWLRSRLTKTSSLFKLSSKKKKSVATEIAPLKKKLTKLILVRLNPQVLWNNTETYTAKSWTALPRLECLNILCSFSQHWSEEGRSSLQFCLTKAKINSDFWSVSR